MPTLPIDPDDPSPETIARAAAVLRRGGLVAFPTETVYGLGANALDAAAVARIFAAKGRPSYNPLITHVADVAAARRLARRWPESAERLARSFWPGPLTLVVPKRADIPDVVTAGLDSVALRVPAHAVALALLREAGLPVAAPSANRSTRLSPTTARHVEQSLGRGVDLILDAGPTRVGIESAVVDLTGAEPVLLRPGLLGPQDLEPVVGALREAAREPVAGAADDTRPRPAPGMLDRHYAPRAELRLFDPADWARAADLARRAAAEGRTVGALLVAGPAIPGARTARLPAEPAAYARRLYAELHALDAACDLILAERVPDDASWAAVRDRLERAAR
jgi:L-threonylcarbamoyladenylate synthase